MPLKGIERKVCRQTDNSSFGIPNYGKIVYMSLEELAAFWNLIQLQQETGLLDFITNSNGLPSVIFPH